MARFGKSNQTKSIGYTPEALRVDELTRRLRSRSGIHFYNKNEVASVFDLICLSRAKYNEAGN